MWLHDGGCAGELTTPPGEHARLIDAEDRDEATVASVGGEETVIVAAAFLDGDFVVGTRETRKLDAGAVLVGPEVGRLDHGALVDPTRKQSRDRDRRSFQRPGPVLDPMSHADGRIVPGRAVPDRDNVREVGLTIGSAQHAIAEHESAAPQPLDVGHTADTHNDDVSRQVASVDQVDARDAIGSWSGVAAASTTVTARPSLRAVEATSAPMNPAPMTTIRAPDRRSARSATASSMVRMTCTPPIVSQPGQRRAREPVAMTTASASTRVPFASSTAPEEVSSLVAAAPSIQSACRSSSSDSSAKSASVNCPQRNSFDSGGRS